MRIFKEEKRNKESEIKIQKRFAIQDKSHLIYLYPGNIVQTIVEAIAY